MEMIQPPVAFIYLLLQQSQTGPELPAVDFAYLGTRGLTGIVMLMHMFFAQLFIGFAIASPLLQAFGKRSGNEWMTRLAHSLARFNVLTFSIGGTIAGMFLVLIVGFYPRVTSALFTHFFWIFPVGGMVAMFLTIYATYIYHYRTQHQSVTAGVLAALFILLWQSILTGVDTFMTTGGGAGSSIDTGAGFSSIGSSLSSIFNPMFIPLDLHRTFANLSWPAFAVATWAAFSYRRAKRADDKAFFDWAGSMGVVWGTGFLLLQPFAGFAVAYSMMKLGYNPGNLPIKGTGGPYDRLVGTGPGAGSWTSNLLYINLLMVVLLFVFASAAMYLGAVRHPERAGRLPIRFLGLLAAVAGLYSVSPIAMFPVFWARYIALLIMVLATSGALFAYVRSRRSFEYGSPGSGYRAVLLSLGVLAAVISLNMGFMKSNSRSPYTIYGQEKYTVQNERPIGHEQLQQQTTKP